jgi:hypothetical protein
MFVTLAGKIEQVWAVLDVTVECGRAMSFLTHNLTGRAALSAFDKGAGPIIMSLRELARVADPAYLMDVSPQPPAGVVTTTSNLPVQLTAALANPAVAVLLGAPVGREFVDTLTAEQQLEALAWAHRAALTTGQPYATPQPPPFLP